MLGLGMTIFYEPVFGVRSF